MSRNASDASFVRCPQCSNGSGSPKRIERSDATQLVMLLSCNRCQHEWRFEADNPPVIFSVTDSTKVPPVD